MSTSPLNNSDAREQIETFFSVISDPAGIYEVRMISTGSGAFSLHGTPAQILSSTALLQDFNAQGWNIHPSINARTEVGGTTAAHVSCAHVLVADFDNTSEADARLAIQRVDLPKPSLLMHSGHGIHAIWRLSEPIHDMLKWSDLQKRLAAAVGSDPSICDPARVMRAPGFFNMKDKDHPVSAAILSADSACVYPLAQIEPLIQPSAATPSKPTRANGERLADGRDRDLYQFACKLRERGLSFDEACTLAWDHHQKHHVADYAREKVNAIVTNAFKYAKNESPEQGSLNTISAGSLLAEHRELQPAVINELLREMEVGNLIGASKSRKTYMALDLALSIVTGHKWLGRFDVRQGKVLYVDCECHPKTLAFRLANIAQSRQLVRNDFADSLQILSLRGRLKDIFALDSFFRSIAKKGFKLIVVDSLYRLMPPLYNENDNAAVTAVYNQLDKIAAMTGAAILVIHHVSKGSQASKFVTDVGSGAGAMSRAVDSHIAIRQHANDDCVVLDAALRSFAPLSPIGLRYQHPVFETDDSIDTSDLKESGRHRKVEPGPGPMTVEDFVEKYVSRGPKTANQISAAAEVDGLSARKARQLLNVCVDDRKAFVWPRAKKNGGDRYATVEEPLPGLGPT